MDSAGHGKAVLAAITAGSGSRQALDYALRYLKPVHFTDSVARELFELAEFYLNRTNGVLNRTALADLLRNKPPGTIQMYAEYFDALSAHVPESGSAFKHSVQQLQELTAEKLTGDTLAQSMEILTTGAMDGKERIQGHVAARQWAMLRFSEIDRDLAQADSPEGDMRTETAELAAAYVARKAARAAGHAPGVALGIPELDKVLGGGQQNGELNLLAGYTSAGKTSVAVQGAWSACVEQGRNVVVFTTETLRHQVRIKLLARHSRHQKFGLASGLNARDIKAGTLNTEQEHAFQAVVNDFGSGQYGRLHIAQVPRGATVATLEASLARITRLWPADLVIIDYLQLLKAEGRRKDMREDLANIIKEAKQVATGYMDGRGVPVLSPWQTSRDGWKQAQERGFYILPDLAETNESGATADVVITVLEPREDNSGGRAVVLKFGVPKNRDGERRAGADQVIAVTADYACSYFEAQGAGTQHESVLDPFGG